MVFGVDTATAQTTVSYGGGAWGPGLDESNASWIEERRSLEDRILHLTEECRALYMEKVSSSMQSLQESAGLHASSSNPRASLSRLQRAHDDAQNQFRAAEVTRLAAEKRASVAEGALTRSLDDITNLRKQSIITNSPSGHSRTLDVGASGTMANKEAEDLKSELQEDCTTLEELDSKIGQRSDQLARNDREHADVKKERDVLYSSCATLQREVDNARRHFLEEREESENVRAELRELREKESNILEEQYASAADASLPSAAKEAFERCRSSLGASEALCAQSRQQAVELQRRLVTVQAAHEQLKSEEAKSAELRDGEVAQLQAKNWSLKEEHATLARRLSEAEAASKELSFRCTSSSESRECSAQTIALERRAAEEVRESIHAEMAEAERHSHRLTVLLQSERRRCADLAREVSCARAVGRSCGYVSPGSGYCEFSANQVASQPTVSDVVRDCMDSTCSQKVASVMELTHKIAQLRSWKNHTLVVLQRLQEDMQTAQQQYRGQLERNQALQSRIEEIHHQAEVIVAAMACPSTANSESVSRYNAKAVPAMPASAPNDKRHAGLVVSMPPLPQLAPNASLQPGMPWSTGPDEPEKSELTSPRRRHLRVERPLMGGGRGSHEFDRPLAVVDVVNADRDPIVPYAAPSGVSGVPVSGVGNADPGPVGGRFYNAYLSRSGESLQQFSPEDGVHGRGHGNDSSRQHACRRARSADAGRSQRAVPAQATVAAACLGRRSCYVFGGATAARARARARAACKFDRLPQSASPAHRRTRSCDV